MNIFVAQLDYSIEESKLQELFEGYGEVSSAKIIMDKFTGRSKGFGFIEMPDDSQAQKAINELNGSDLEGRDIVVKKANPRESNSRGDDRY
jgi:RNA recognition motif-containing protein